MKDNAQGKIKKKKFSQSNMYPYEGGCAEYKSIAGIRIAGHICFLTANNQPVIMIFKNSVDSSQIR